MDTTKNEETGSVETLSNYMEETIYSQLHEQFAINDNAKNNNFITFLIAIFALFGVYGYVFVHTYLGAKNNLFQDGLVIHINDVEYFHPSVFAAITCATLLIFMFLSILVLFLGYSTRRDHIVIARIREKILNKGQSIFDKSLYNPYNKGFSGFIPDYYNIFFWAFFVIKLILVFTLYTRLCCICFTNPIFVRDLPCCCMNIAVILSLVSPLIFRFHYLKKYNELTNKKS